MKRLAFALVALLAASTARAQYQGATVPGVGPLATSVTTRVHNLTLPAIVWATADASAAGLDHPFTDPDYRFDLGCPGDQFSHPVSGEWTDSRWQSGPLAVGVYYSPGDYDVSLTTRIWDGSSLQTATATSTVTIVDPQTTTVYLDSNAPAGGDGTEALPWNTPLRLQAAVRGARDKRIRLACGSVFVMPTPLSLGNDESGVVIESYGTGAPPVIRAGSGLGCLFPKVDDPGKHCADVVFSGIDFDAAGRAIVMQAFQANGGTLDGLGFLTCRFYGCATGSKPMKIQAVDQDCIRDVCFWNCVLDGGKGAMQNLFLRQHGVGFAMLMTKVVGGNPLAHEILDHHLYLKDADDLLLRWVSFDRAGRFNYCINGNCASVNAEPLPGPVTTKRWLIAECNIQGTRNGIDMGEANNNSQRGRFGEVVIQGNALHNLGVNGGVPPSRAQCSGILYNNADRVVVRGNWFYRNQAPLFLPLQGTPAIRADDAYTDLQIYSNQFFIPAASQQTLGIIQFKAGGDLSRCLVRDNWFDDRRAGPPQPITNALGVDISGNRVGAADSAIGVAVR